MPRSISPEFYLYFGPDSIWAVDEQRPPGYWVVCKPDREHTDFHGPFDSSQTCTRYMQEDPEVFGSIDDPKAQHIYRDENLAPAPEPIAPVEALSGTARGEQRRLKVIIREYAQCNVEHGTGHSEHVENMSARKFVASCLESILNEHPRSDLRVVLGETIKELRS